MSQENATSKQPLIRPINRQQMSWRAVDVERLIGEDHRARAIWTLVGRLDLQPFYDDIESSVEEGGRQTLDARHHLGLEALHLGQPPDVGMRRSRDRVGRAGHVGGCGRAEKECLRTRCRFSSACSSS